MNVVTVSEFPVCPSYFLAIFEKLKKSYSQDVYHYAYRYLVAGDPILQSVADTFKLRHEIFFLTLGTVQKGLPIHKDGALGMEYYASLNLPLKNCDEKTETIFYKGDENTFESKFGARFYNGSTPLIESERFTFCSQSKTYYLFNSNTWHQVKHKSDFSNERVMMAWRFRSEIKMVDAIALFASQNLLTVSEKKV